MGAKIPTVSIVMPAFNASKTIAESIESVLNQSYSDWELIIVDDGSQDNTAEMADQYIKKDGRIALLKLNQNAGLPNARNVGCKTAKGYFIAFLDSDDLWHPGKLQAQVKFHTEKPSIKISHTDFHAFNSKGSLKRPFKYFVDLKKYKHGNIYPHVCYKNPIGVLTVMAKRSLLQEVNFFDATLWTMEDHDLWVRIAKSGEEFGYLSQVLASYRMSEGGITSKTGKYKRAYKQFIRKIYEAGEINRDLLLRYYYRHFGTVYFRKSEYRLTRLYFCKSITIGPHDFIAFSTLMYLVIALSKQGIQKFNSLVNFIVK